MGEGRADRNISDVQRLRAFILLMTTKISKPLYVKQKSIQKLWAIENNEHEADENMFIDLTFNINITIFRVDKTKTLKKDDGECFGFLWITKDLSGGE